MVSKITIFETRFDGAQFGPTTVPGENSAREGVTADRDPAGEASESSGVQPVVLAVLAAAVALFVGVLAMRLVGTDDEESVESDERSVDVPTVG